MNGRCIRRAEQRVRMLSLVLNAIAHLLLTGQVESLLM